MDHEGGLPAVQSKVGSRSSRRGAGAVGGKQEQQDEKSEHQECQPMAKGLLHRFALLDAQIADLTNSGTAEMVVGPVVFDNFVLDHPGRYVPSSLQDLHNFF